MMFGELRNDSHDRVVPVSLLGFDRLYAVTTLVRGAGSQGFGH